MAEIVVRRVKSIGRRPLGKRGPITVGRSSECDVVLSDNRVSRHHCIIELGNDGSCRVHDKGSKFGTSVNGVRVEKASPPLAAGDVIGVAQFELVYIAEEPVVIGKGEQDELRAELEVREMRIEVLMAELADVERERDDARSARDVAQRALAAIREQHARDLDDLSAKHADAISDLEERHERSANDLRSDLEQSAADLATELEDARAGAEAAGDHAAEAHARELAELRSEHERTLAEQGSTHESARRELEDEVAALRAALDAAPPAETAHVVEPARAARDATRHLSNVQITLSDREARFAEVDEILASAGDDAPADLVAERDELARDFETVHGDRDAAIEAVTNLVGPLSAALEGVDGAAPLQPHRPKKKWFGR